MVISANGCVSDDEELSANGCVSDDEELSANGCVSDDEELPKRTTTKRSYNCRALNVFSCPIYPFKKTTQHNQPSVSEKYEHKIHLKIT